MILDVLKITLGVIMILEIMYIIFLGWKLMTPSEHDNFLKWFEKSKKVIMATIVTVVVQIIIFVIGS